MTATLLSGPPDIRWAFGFLLILIIVGAVIQHFRDRPRPELPGSRVRPLRRDGVVYDPSDKCFVHGWTELHLYGGVVLYCSCGTVIQAVGETRVPTVAEAADSPVHDPWETKPHEREGS